jgi:hypothetical protein
MNRTFFAALSKSAVFYIILGNLALLYSSNQAIATSPAEIRLQLVQSSEATMTPEQLETILQSEATDIQTQEGMWQFTLENRTMVVLVNEENDRMRIVTPIISVDRLTSQQVQNILIANYHTTLDARYAITNDILVSVFTHPLSSLQENDFRSALYQVVRLAANFGTTYSSDDLILAPNQQPQQEQPEIK